jgi:hypothetical protein
MPALTALPAISKTSRATLPAAFIFSISAGVFTSITQGSNADFFLGCPFEEKDVC